MGIPTRNSREVSACLRMCGGCVWWFCGIGYIWKSKNVEKKCRATGGEQKIVTMFRLPVNFPFSRRIDFKKKEFTHTVMIPLATLSAELRNSLKGYRF